MRFVMKKRRCPVKQLATFTILHIMPRYFLGGDKTHFRLLRRDLLFENNVSLREK